MKSVSWIWIVAILGIFSCEEEEFVTQRFHPFVKSLDVTQIDETGATVEFEILKDGSAAIQEYGVEYALSTEFRPGNNPEFVKIAQSGAPASSLISLRLSYDLIKDMDYVVRPFVASGGTMVYGENLVFTSMGVNSPQVSRVSPTEIFLNEKMIIEGDFFNSNVSDNSVVILGLEEQYRVTLDSASHQRLVVSIEARSAGIIPTDAKFDLKITSSGKSTILPGLIGVTVPRIVDVGPLNLYVGDRVQVQLDRPLPGESIYFYLGYDQTPSSPLVLIPKEMPGMLEGYIPGIPPGKYPLSMHSTYFTDEYSDQVEVLQSWQTYQDGIQFPTLTSEWGVTELGDHLLIWNRFEGDLVDFSSYDLGAAGLRPLAPVPFLPKYRSGSLAVGVAGRHFYYGLGYMFETNKETNFKDFHRYDITTNQWEKLADFPFDATSVVAAFSYQDKIYAVIYNYLNFRVYDPNLNQWSMSPIEVPAALRNASNNVVIEDYIYFLSSHAPITVSRYKIGGNVEVFSQVNQYAYNGATLSSWDENLIVLEWGTPSLRIGLATRQVKPMQSIYDSEFSKFIPWRTSKGLMMAFPAHKNNYTQENKIYQLIQDF